MNKKGFDYDIWQVPGDFNNSDYEILNAVPQVESAQHLGKQQPKGFRAFLLNYKGSKCKHTQ